MRALVTGGAGFIGRRLASALTEDGWEVRVLDRFDPSVHAGVAPPPSGSELERGDVRDPAALDRSLRGGMDCVFHQAAVVGLGRGALDADSFLGTNVVGTVELFRAIGRLNQPPPRVVLASSMALYGEGAYDCPACAVARPGARRNVDLQNQRWEPLCTECGSTLQPRPVDERQVPRPGTMYARSKLLQEQVALELGQEHGITVVSLRYHNVYGPGMPRGTLYSGVMALFKSRLLDGLAPVVCEDGEQLRDFIHVDDVVAANRLAASAEASTVGGEAINVGTGRPSRVGDVARTLTRMLAPERSPEFPGTFRSGDARHVYASVDKARRLLGFEPAVELSTGLLRFAREDAMRPTRDSEGAGDGR